MPDENRVFDITKPDRINPTATSRPVIVGHQPTMNDPMVRENQEQNHEPGPTHIPVQDDSLKFSYGSTPYAQPQSFVGPAEPVAGQNFAPQAKPDLAFKPAIDQFNPPASKKAEPTPHIEALHVAKRGKKKRTWWKAVAGLLALLIAGYLAIDSGLIGSGINLPVHLFKQKSPITQPAAISPATTTTPTVPDGFTKYSLASTPISFLVPTKWGAPSSTTDPGFSTRGGSNKSDGTHAYLVSFAKNKDIQIAVTSSNYLPVARGALYYDSLQWCAGTKDTSQFYESSLLFTTKDKIDTPSTVACDRGPVPDVTKLDQATIVQSKVLDLNKAVIGDIYSKNLDSTDLPVFRVKDAAMTNDDDIKVLLSSVTLSAA